MSQQMIKNIYIIQNLNLNNLLVRYPISEE